MAGNNLIQIKRTSISGRAANTTTLPNPGELALNMADGILYSGNGTFIFEIGSNTTNSRVTGNLTVNNIVANNTTGLPGQVLTSDGSIVYWSTAVGFTGSQGTTGFNGSQGQTGFVGSKGDQGYNGSIGATGFTGSQGDLGFTGSQGIQGQLGYTGSQGNQGQSGFVGSKGDTGFTGSQGIIGFTGSQGDIGYSGSQGIQGNIGFTGSKGDIGFVGSQGDIGYSGSQGIQGNIGYSGSKGDTGFVGSQGPQGPQGTFGGAAFNYIYSSNTTHVTTPDGYFNFSNTNLSNANTLYIDYLDALGANSYLFLQTIDDSTSSIKGHFSIKDSANTLNYTMFAITGSHTEITDHFEVPISYLSGATSFVNGTNTIITFARTGDIGDKGYTGSKGDIGYTGSLGFAGSFGYTGSLGYTGSQGDQGIIGFTGSKGDIGFVGSKGDQGYTGSKGDQGYTGSQGIIGFTGSQGDIGFTGSQGIQGVSGYTGSQGVQGQTGFVGSKGDQGYNGSIGASGFTGSQGDFGFTGSQGIQGNIGYTGSQGNQGTTGFTGSQGSTGVTGYTGSQGTQGVIGYTGSQGVQGNSGYTGSQGTTGFDGSTGYTGSSGYSGSLGFTGSQGISADINLNSFTFTGNGSNTQFSLSSNVTQNTIIVSINGLLQTPVSAYSVTGSNNIIIFTEAPGSNSSIEVKVVSGGIGYAGSMGIPGPAGGYTGSQGTTGYNGSIGSLGYTGSIGIGYTGSQGTTGFTGSLGNIGYTGSQGTTGFTGSTGFDGSIGFTGSTGPVAGSDTQIAFNDGGFANGSPGLTFNKTTQSLTVNGSITIGGNVYIVGNVTTYQANNLQITDNMIYLNSNGQFANPDVGFAAGYNDGVYHHAGFFRDHGSGIWKVFENYLPEPQANIYIDQSNNTFRLANFQANAIYTTGIYANNTLGTAGQVLVTNSTGVYWSSEFVSNTYNSQNYVSNSYYQTAAVGISNNYATNNLTSNNYLKNANLTINGFTTFSNDIILGINAGIQANGTHGTAGQVLTSNGTTAYWSTQVGFTGSQGTTGYTGSQGDQGNLGYTGSQGSLGYTGSKGDIGSTGFTGSVGGLGYTGSKGDTGTTGFTGSQGDLGYTGSQGVGFTGSQGIIGYTGSAATGNSVIISGSQKFVADGTTNTFTLNALTYTNTNIFVTLNGLLLTSEDHYNVTGNALSFTVTPSNTDYIEVLSLSGVGYTGSAGTGFTGSAGTAGTTGFTGSAGNLGYTGSTGAGYTGSQGSTGFTGSSGGANVGSNNQILYRNSSNTLTGSDGLQYDGTSLRVNGNLESRFHNGDEGGEIYLEKPDTNTTLASGVTIDVYQNKLRIFENGGTNRGAYIDITAATAGVGSNLLAGGGGGGDVSNAYLTSAITSNSYATNTFSGNAYTRATYTSNSYVRTGTITFTGGEKTFSANVYFNSNVVANNVYANSITIANNTSTVYLTLTGSNNIIQSNNSSLSITSNLSNTTSNATYWSSTSYQSSSGSVTLSRNLFNALILYGRDKFVVVGAGGNNGTANNSFYSYDGINWNFSSNSTNFNTVLNGNQLYGAYGDGKYVVSDTGTTLWYSNNGIQWSNVVVSGISGITSVSFAGGKFFINGSSNTILYSYDATTWSTTTAPVVQPSGGICNFVYGKGVYVASASGGAIFSYDGITWYNCIGGPGNGTSINSAGIAFGNGLFTSGTYYSYDGINWNTCPGQISLGPSSQVIYYEGFFYAFTINSGLRYYYYSEDGLNWYAFNTPVPFNMFTAGKGLILASQYDTSQAYPTLYYNYINGSLSLSSNKPITLDNVDIGLNDPRDASFITLGAFNGGIGNNFTIGKQLSVASNATSGGFIANTTAAYYNGSILSSNSFNTTTFASNSYLRTSAITFTGGVKTYQANVTFSSNISVIGIIANGSIGSAGQVLTSNGTGTFWSTGPSGYTGSQGAVGFTGSAGSGGGGGASANTIFGYNILFGL